LEKAILAFEKKLPSTDIRFFVVTPDVVEDPQRWLDNILKNPDAPEQVERYERAFAQDKAEATQAVMSKEVHYSEKYISAFTEKRIDLIVTWHLLSGIEVEGLFGEVVSMIGEVRDFESSYADKKKIQISFTEDAVDEILSRAVTSGISAAAVCQDVSGDYDYAFKLIMDKTGQQEFILTSEAIEDPESYVNDLIRKSYGTGPFAIPGPHKESK
jgi:hypothetical protein